MSAIDPFLNKTLEEAFEYCRNKGNYVSDLVNVYFYTTNELCVELHCSGDDGCFRLLPNTPENLKLTLRVLMTEQAKTYLPIAVADIESKIREVNHLLAVAGQPELLLELNKVVP